MSCLLMGWDYFQIVLFSSHPPPPTSTPVDTINKPVVLSVDVFLGWRFQQYLSFWC